MGNWQAILVDTTKCMGCGSCTVACKMWNQLPYVKNAPATGPSPVSNYSNWTTLTHKKVDHSPKQVWRFVKRQCMHCNEPACVSSCFSKALQKTERGPVVYHPDLCVGCRYCILACPFEAPKYEWHKPIPSVSKCQMCSTRLEKGQAPACVGVCPTGALLFGEYTEILSIAREKIHKDNRYIPHIYGEKEAGGTSWLYLADTPFAALGFPTAIPLHALPRYTKKYLRWTPPLLVGGSALFTLFSLYSARRRKIEEQENS